MANMDCASEEADIRHALKGLSGIHALQFRLGDRVLGIAADETALPQALDAVRKAGFKPEPINTASRQASPAVPQGRCCAGQDGARTCKSRSTGSTADRQPNTSSACAHDAGAHRAHAPDAASSGVSDARHPDTDEDFSRPPQSFWQQWGKLLTALVLALGAEVLAFSVGHEEGWRGWDSEGGVALSLLGMALAACAIFLSGFSVYGKGMAALRQRRLNINALMTVAVTGAFLIGQWPEAAMVMALYALAETIEARAVDRARNAIKSLLALTPEEADMQQPDGRWLRTPIKTVPLDALVRVRPGERVPLDGIVAQGQSSIDQSPITGESLPIDKTAGDEVFAGTINQAGELIIRVRSAANDSTLARIIHAVEAAQSARAPTQRFVDRFAAVYTPAVFLIALAVALLLPITSDRSWLEAIYTALVLLVIACPCALVISTPVTVVSALASAARRGILIKGGAYLEEARYIRAVALDKTGTITEGQPRLVALERIDSSLDLALIRQLINSLAIRSDHPVSRAIAQGIQTPHQRVASDGSSAPRQQKTAAAETAESLQSDRPSKDSAIAPDLSMRHAAVAPPLPVTDFQAVAGRGVQGKINLNTAPTPDGDVYALANHRWIEERGQCTETLDARLAVHEAAGRTVTLLANSTRVLALAAVADTIKPSSAEAIARLKAQGVTPVMLTGDNLATARHVAEAAGISEVKANLLPEEKLQAIAQLQQQHGATAMTGDGINDAPALAKADIGFAMGGIGTHTAVEAADIVIMNDDLRRVPETMTLSRHAHRVLWQNISLALGIKAVFLLLAILGQATMWMAVFADMGASLLVVFNGLRLLRWQARQPITS
ncbi:MAG: heavy metal translocating P-type ATPase [Lautropia sp.]|nr:heavy metal translocating P-type ATPase [Lautropia sp.]